MPQRSSGSVRVFYPRLDRAAVLRALQDGMERLRAALPILRVVLFGSYAKGTHTVASDVDLLVVYAGQSRPDAYARTKRALPLPGLEPHVYSEAEYAAVAPTVDRMVEDGVLVYPRPPQ